MTTQKSRRFTSAEAVLQSKLALRKNKIADLQWTLALLKLNISNYTEYRRVRSTMILIKDQLVELSEIQTAEKRQFKQFAAYRRLSAESQAKQQYRREQSARRRAAWEASKSAAKPVAVAVA